MSKKNLLICFDAFGTLFTPRKPVAQQYSEVARSFGLGGFSDDNIAQSFKKAFKHESKTNPNYGKKTGMGAEKWWGNVSPKVQLSRSHQNIQLFQCGKTPIFVVQNTPPRRHINWDGLLPT
jgi:hypothetical protein